MTGRRRARISLSYDFPAESGTSGCKGKLVWHLHPTKRVSVSDGTWQLQFSDGETQTMSVTGGGRLITGLSTPAAISDCTGGSGTFNPVIAADGVASATDSENGTFSLKLAYDHASGSFVDQTSGCGLVDLSMSATLTKKAP